GGLKPGSKSEELADVLDTEIVELDDLEWRVLMALKREFAADEICRDLWQPRADEAGVSLETFYDTARGLNARGVVGRFSTFLEHFKPLATGGRGTRFKPLFHSAVPPRPEIQARRHGG